MDLSPVPVDLPAANVLLERNSRHTVYTFFNVRGVFVLVVLERVVSVPFGWSTRDVELLERAHQGGFWALMHKTHAPVFKNPRVGLKAGKLVLFSDPKITTKLE